MTDLEMWGEDIQEHLEQEVLTILANEPKSLLQITHQLREKPGLELVHH